MTKPHQPWFIRYPTPPGVKKVHILGMAGSGMGAFACMLQEAGYEVRGSDRAAYPPMSEILAARQLPLSLGWDPSALDCLSLQQLRLFACLTLLLISFFPRLQTQRVVLS